jgi:hypothetical protein
LSAIFSRDFRSRGEQDKRREHAADVILGYLRQSAG